MPSASLPMDPSQSADGSSRKRVCKACDRCRLKKSKCDGSSPCSRCVTDNAICVFGERKKSYDKVYPKGYVEMLENQQAQLVAGLQELYKRAQNGKGWPGSRLKERNDGGPLTHDILERLGALRQDDHNSTPTFEENLHQLQRKLMRDAADYRSRESSSHSESGSEAPQSPVFEEMSFVNPFATNQFPPTPPSQSPYQQTSAHFAPRKAQTYTHPRMSQSAMNPALLQTSPVGFIDNMNFINKFESPISFNDISIPFSSTISSGIENINPCLPWMEDDAYY